MVENGEKCYVKDVELMAERNGTAGARTLAVTLLPAPAYWSTTAEVWVVCIGW